MVCIVNTISKQYVVSFYKLVWTEKYVSSNVLILLYRTRRFFFQADRILKP
jgi:hypothetical protein